MRRLIAMAFVLAITQVATAGPMQITEWMYSGTDGEYIEFTNTGATPVDMTGWTFVDNDPNHLVTPTSLSGFGVVAPGQSVILTEVSATSFISAWGLSGVSVIGGNTNNLGRSDAINLYDATSALVDRLIYNDQAGQGPRTQNKSCNIPTSGYGEITAQTGWGLASVGDGYGSWASTGADIASPGRVPEPATLTALVLGAIVLHRRWR